jgi:hypothetical protein
MSVQFEFRVLAEEPYREVVELLDRSSAGARSSFDLLRERVRAALRDPAMAARHSWSGVLRVWSEWLDGATLSAEAIARLAPIAIAACSMPEYQLSHAAGPDPAGTLAVLGDDDGGLFGVLTGREAWFEPWLVSGLQGRAERYAYGRAMFRMSGADRSRLLGALPGLKADCDSAASPDHCREALSRLAELLRLASETPGWSCAVCESG